MIKDGVLKILAVILSCILVLLGMPYSIVAASDGDVAFTVDVWTNKGGQGANVAGGIYEVGEDIIIYLKANEDCQASVIISGPSTGYPGQLVDAMPKAGETYTLPLGEAGEIDIGQWEISLDAASGEQFASDTSWFTVVAAQSPTTPLTLDVWTNKGGEGRYVSGGAYNVGEEIIISVEVSITSEVTWTLTGPLDTDSGEQLMDAGTYDLNLGQAEEADIGQWRMVVEARADWAYAYDATSFTIVAVEPEKEATPKIDASNATELYALMALKMFEGVLPVDLSMDANGDGQVNVEDARLILKWSVNGK